MILGLSDTEICSVRNGIVVRCKRDFSWHAALPCVAEPLLISFVTCSVKKKTKKRCVIDFCSFCNVRAASRPDLRGSAYPPPKAVFNVFDNGIKKYTAHYSFLLFCRVVFPVFISEINNRNMNVTKTRKLLGSTYHSVVIQLKIPKSENQKKRFVISLCVCE